MAKFFVEFVDGLSVIILRYRMAPESQRKFLHVLQIFRLLAEQNAWLGIILRPKYWLDYVLPSQLIELF